MRRAQRLSVGLRGSGNGATVIWLLYLLLAALVVVAIWLAIVVIKWLFILAVVAGVAWLLLLARRRFSS